MRESRESSELWAKAAKDMKAELSWQLSQVGTSSCMCDRSRICCPDSCTSNRISANKVKEGTSWKDMIVKVGPQRFCKLLSFEYDFILIN